MTKILAIDSSTEACSVALEIDGKTYHQFEIAPRQHAQLLLPMVDNLLNQADISLDQLDAVACCVGPGAFTGLRIAISVAQGLSYATNLPCIPISSLELLAAEAFSNSDAQYCLSALDARMKEVYFSVYKNIGKGLAEEVHTQQVIAADKIELDPTLLLEMNKTVAKASSVIKAGTGWDEYEFSQVIKSLDIAVMQIKYPNAKMMLPLALEKLRQKKWVKAESLQPVYIRNNVAKKKSQQK